MEVVNLPTSLRSKLKIRPIHFRAILILSLTLIAVGFGWQSGEACQIKLGSADLSLENFDTFIDQISPEPDELVWQQIAWESQLSQAIERAHREDKPILIWAMNGHPLGCT